MGRHKYIESPEALWELFEQYTKEAKSSPIKVTDWVGGMAKEVTREKERPLTMEGFDLYCFKQGIITSLEQYFSNRENRYESFVGICSRIRQAIRADQIEGGMAGIYNPSITQRLNNLVEKVQEDGNKNITVKVKYESKGTGNSSESTTSGAD